MAVRYWKPRTVAVAQVDTGSIDSVDATPSNNVFAVTIGGVEYVYGQVESTGGALWVVGRDPVVGNDRGHHRHGGRRRGAVLGRADRDRGGNRHRDGLRGHDGERGPQ